MIKQISDNIIFVQGACGGAIYNFLSNNVYALNHDGCDIMVRQILHKKQVSPYANEFISKINVMLNINHGYTNIEYEFPEYQPQLRSAWLEITQNCNLKCVHCYEGDVHYDSDKVLTLQNWIDLIEQLKDVGCKEVRFIGGEPTLFKNIEQLLAYTNKMGLKSILFTNLTFLSDKLLNTLVSSNTHVMFSLYGANAYTHDKITTTHGSFEKLIQNVDKLKSVM